jgi:hypothetical protein
MRGAEERSVPEAICTLAGFGRVSHDGDSVVNLLHAIGACQQGRSFPVRLNFLCRATSSTGSFGVTLLDSLRMVGVRPWALDIESWSANSSSQCDSLASPLADGIVTASVPHSARTSPHPSADGFLVSLDDVASSWDWLEQYLRGVEFLAVVVSGGSAHPAVEVESLRRVGEGGRLRWVFGDEARLGDLGLVENGRRASWLNETELVMTSGRGVVTVLAGSSGSSTKFSITEDGAPENPAAVADAYCGGFLHGRLLGGSISEAHASGHAAAFSLASSGCARKEPDRDLNNVFGGLTDRRSQLADDGKLFLRVRMSPGVTVVSGGQTGIDQLALEVAQLLGLAAYCILPSGERTEVTEGLHPGSDNFADAWIGEVGSSSYRFRTWTTAYLGDATLIWDFCDSEGCDSTRAACRALGRPYLDIAPFGEDPPLEQLTRWLNLHSIRRLNIAGNRMSFLTLEQAESARRSLTKVLRSFAMDFAGRASSTSRDPASMCLVKPGEDAGDLRVGIANIPSHRALFSDFFSESYGVRLEAGRCLWTVDEAQRISIVRMRPRDLPTALHRGCVDLVFCGSDLFMEERLDHTVLLETGLHAVALVMTEGPTSPLAKWPPRRVHGGSAQAMSTVVSQYPKLTGRVLTEDDNGMRVLPILGSAEAWIASGAAHWAVDTWRTGATCEANGVHFNSLLAESWLIGAIDRECEQAVARRAAQLADRLAHWLRGF